jgi:hypothetical protein
MKNTLLACALLLVAVPAAGQESKRFTECDAPHHKILMKGQTIAIDCDFAVVLNDKEAGAIALKGETMERLVGLLERRRQLSDELTIKQDLLIASGKQIDEIQEKYYERLKLDTEQALELAKRAAKNTDEALWLAKRSRYAGWFSSTVVGGVAGGVVGLQRGDDWQRSGLFALTGAAAGFLVSWAINH